MPGATLWTNFSCTTQPADTFPSPELNPIENAPEPAIAAPAVTAPLTETSIIEPGNADLPPDSPQDHSDVRSEQTTPDFNPGHGRMRMTEEFDSALSVPSSKRSPNNPMDEFGAAFIQEVS